MRFSTSASLLAAVVVGSTSDLANNYEESDSLFARDVDMELEARQEAIENYVRELRYTEALQQVSREIADMIAAREGDEVAPKHHRHHRKGHRGKGHHKHGKKHSEEAATTLPVDASAAAPPTADQAPASADPAPVAAREDMEGIILDLRDFLELNEVLEARFRD